MNDLRGASPQVKRFLAGALLNSLGGGLTLPVLVIYLNQVRGRYNSVDGLVWVFAGAVGPAISGFMLQFELVAAWIGLIVLGQVIGGISALRLRRVLTPTQDGLLKADEK